MNGATGDGTGAAASWCGEGSMRTAAAWAAARVGEKYAPGAAGAPGHAMLWVLCVGAASRRYE